MDAAMVRRARERVGAVLREKWRLDKLIGVGGMAAVYASTHRNKKRGAVKLLHAELSLNEDTRTRFLREGYVANHVDHPGAVSVLDDDVAEDGSVYLVMELLDGRNLEHILRTRTSGRFEIGEVLSIADAALDVLAAAHDKGIIHRDIKPDNLFITKAGQLKVLDFGIARVRKEAPSASDTATGVAIGTPMYMPPEQALGEWNKVDGRTDLWSVGASMFALLSGREVRDAENIQKLFLSAMTEPIAALGSVAPGLPQEICALVDRAVAFEMAHRFASAREMQGAVRALRARFPGALTCESLPLEASGAVPAATAPAVAAYTPATPPGFVQQAAPTPGFAGVPVAAMTHAVVASPMASPAPSPLRPDAGYGPAGQADQGYPAFGQVPVATAVHPPAGTTAAGEPFPVSPTLASPPSLSGAPQPTLAQPRGAQLAPPMHPTPLGAVLAAHATPRRSPVVPIVLVAAALVGAGGGVAFYATRGASTPAASNTASSNTASSNTASSNIVAQAEPASDAVRAASGDADQAAPPDIVASPRPSAAQPPVAASSTEAAAPDPSASVGTRIGPASPPTPRVRPPTLGAPTAPAPTPPKPPDPFEKY